MCFCQQAKYLFSIHVKSINQRFADELWKRVFQSHDIVQSSIKSKTKYGIVNAENCFRFLDSSFSDRFGINGFNKVEDEVWVKKFDESISHKISANVWKKYLPEIVYLSPSWSVSADDLAPFMNKYFEKSYGIHPNIFSIWSKDAFPRVFKDSKLTIRLDSIDTVENLKLMLNDLADRLLVYSERFFSSFSSIDEIVAVVERGKFAWGDRAIITNKTETLGYLYLLQKNPRGAVALFQKEIDHLSSSKSFGDTSDKRILLMRNAINAIEHDEIVVN